MNHFVKITLDLTNPFSIASPFSVETQVFVEETDGISASIHARPKTESRMPVGVSSVTDKGSTSSETSVPCDVEGNLLFPPVSVDNWTDSKLLSKGLDTANSLIGVLGVVHLDVTSLGTLRAFEGSPSFS